MRSKKKTFLRFFWYKRELCTTKITTATDLPIGLYKRPKTASLGNVPTNLPAELNFFSNKYKKLKFELKVPASI